MASCLQKSSVGYQYVNCCYRNLGTTRDLMVAELMTAQHCYCCYCMRDLSYVNPRARTIEHIIPDNADIENFNEYMNLKLPELARNWLVHKNSVKGRVNAKVPPYPHDVAFDNFVLSCDGCFPQDDGEHLCCNNRRGSQFVYPLYFIADIENKLIFSPDGKVKPVKMDATQAIIFFQAISALQLNVKILRYIRRLWHLLSPVGLKQLEDCRRNKDQRTNILRNALFKSADPEQLDEDNEILRRFMKDSYWDLFLSYHWFYGRI